MKKLKATAIFNSTGMPCSTEESQAFNPLLSQPATYGHLPACTILGLSRGELLTDTAVEALFCFIAWNISTSFSLSARWEARD